MINSVMRDEGGATMVEYGLLVGLVAMVAMAAVQALGVNLSTVFSTVANSI
jgi:pilus assembly protein Flp/PilA